MISEDLSEFQSIAQQLIKTEKTNPVAQPIAVEDLNEQLDLSLNEEGMNDEALYATLQNLVMSTPRTASNKFFNQLFGGRRGKAVLGDLLAVMLNNSMYTYKVAGPMVGVEKMLLTKICQMIGYGERANGTIAPGGSMSNFMGLVMARDAYKDKNPLNYSQEKLVLYTSVSSHYSTPKNAQLIGLEKQQIRHIESDRYGRMDMAALEEQIESDRTAGLQPFFVNATAGTTVLGAFDPIDTAADVCEKHQLWLHVDGAYCGAVIFSKKYRHLVQGLNRSNSFSVNAHKMLGTPLSCSIIVTQDKKHLYNSFASDAKYLYQTDGDDYNLGKTSIQCGRRNDALKFWTLWKSIGTSGLEQLVDHQFHLASIARDYVQNHPDYTLYSYDNSISVCFNYKDIPAETICTALYEESVMMVGFGTFKTNTFVRLITINSDNEESDILRFFETLEGFVETHYEQLAQTEAVTNS